MAAPGNRLAVESTAGLWHARIVVSATGTLPLLARAVRPSMS
ncbi:MULTISPECIES: hypothetical protein [unclassified Nonomuraea]